MSCDKNRLSPGMNIVKGFHNCRVFLANGLWFMQFFVRSIGVLLWVGEKGLGCCGDALFMRPFGFAQGDRWGEVIIPLNFLSPRPLWRDLRMLGAILQPQPAPWLYWVRRIFSLGMVLFYRL